ncbi:histone deacetylase family protein [Acidovorax sp. FG27]|uniref:histone deacetylase family protein n=1 Tax=Acidovorax sp. FG27 TaxID=3133652 RepID=UPI0030E9AADE
MLILHNPLQSRHAGRQEMFRGRLVDCHEHPGRFDHVMDALAQRPQGPLATPCAADMALVRRVHASEYLDFLQNAWAQWLALDAANAALDILPSVWPGHGLRRDVHPANFSAQVGRFAFDSGSPITAGTWEAAEAGAACAIDAARAVATAGGPRAAFALTRPPGHHAGTDFYGGYCFLNNSALAAQALREAGMERVAVLDVDYHHGNGTQQIFYGRGDVLTVSLHGDPLTEYPFYLGYADETGEGEGAGWNLNLPLAAGTGVDAWFDALQRGLARVAQSDAGALVVALGVDTFAGDPISQFRLQSPDYLRIGRQIATAGLPTVFVLEGGYAVAEIGVNVVNVLEGFASAAG